MLCFFLIAVAAIVSADGRADARCQYGVGVIAAMTVPGASIGIPYAKGAAAGVAFQDGVDNQLNLIELMM